MASASSDMTNKVCVVTGSNTGIGEVTARELARAGAHVIMACRSEDKARAAMDRIVEGTGNDNIELVLLDLGSFDKIRASAQELLDRELAIDVLVNNAGLAGSRGVTEDGFEIQFGVNHLGPFLYTNLLLDCLKRAGEGARIVNVASRAHYRVKDGVDWDALTQKTRTRTAFAEYSVSKLANVLFNAQLARELDGTGINTYAVHPGVVASDIWRKVPWPVRSIMKLWMVTNEEGAETSLYCATAPECADESGLYYDECKARTPSQFAQDEALQKEMWERSAEWVGLV